MQVREKRRQSGPTGPSPYAVPPVSDETRDRRNNWESLASQGVSNRWYAKKVRRAAHSTSQH